MLGSSKMLQTPTKMTLKALISTGCVVASSNRAIMSCCAGTLTAREGTFGWVLGGTAACHGKLGMMSLPERTSPLDVPLPITSTRAFEAGDALMANRIIESTSIWAGTMTLSRPSSSKSSKPQGGRGVVLSYLCCFNQ